MNSIYYTHYCSFEQHFLYNVDVYFVKIIIRCCQSFVHNYRTVRRGSLLVHAQTKLSLYEYA